MMPPSKVELLFVHKTGQSPSLSNCRGDEIDQRRLQQHVQRARRLDINSKRRQGQATESPSSPRRRSHSSDLPYTILELRLHNETKESEIDSLFDRQINASTGVDHKGTRKRRHHQYTRIQNDQPSPSSRHFSQASGMPLDLNTPGSEDSYEDPSQSLKWSNGIHYMLSCDGVPNPSGNVAIPLTADTYQILHYFTTQYLPATIRDDENPCLSMPAPALETLTQETVKLSLSDPLCTFALLAAAASRMVYVSHHRLPKQDLPVVFTQITLRLLRRRLAEEAAVTEQLILAVKFLDAMEAYTFNWRAVLIHQKMIKHLGDRHFGGAQNLCYVIRKVFGSVNMLSFTTRATARIFKAAYVPSGPASYSFYNDMVAALVAHDVLPLASAFRLYTDHFTSQFRTVLDRVVELTTLLQCHWTGVCPESTKLPDHAWVVNRSFELVEDLAALPSEANTEDPALLIQECLRLALMYDMQFVPYNKTSIRREPYANIQAIVNTKSLKHALVRYANEYHTENGACKFYFGVDIRPLLLYIAERGVLLSEPGEDMEAFATLFQSLALECGISSFVDFKEKIHRYFFSLDALELANDGRIPRLFEKMEVEVQAGRFDLGANMEKVVAAESRFIT